MPAGTARRRTSGQSEFLAFRTCSSLYYFPIAHETVPAAPAFFLGAENRRRERQGFKRFPRSIPFRVISRMGRALVQGVGERYIARAATATWTIKINAYPMLQRDRIAINVRDSFSSCI